MHLVASIFLIALYVILLVHFAFTLIAIVRGAAPIPSRRSTVKRLMKLAQIKPGETLMDLGSGDGRILFAAAKHGATCVGVEINPLLVWFTRVRAWFTRMHSVSVQRTNLWDVDLRTVDIVTVYMVPIYMQRLKEKVQAEMKPGSRILAAVHPFPDWPPLAHDQNVFLYQLSPSS